MPWKNRKTVKRLLQLVQLCDFWYKKQTFNNTVTCILLLMVFKNNSYKNLTKGNISFCFYKEITIYY